jgi:predicted transcriptional regulator
MFTNNTKKINRSYTIDKLLAERFKQIADKDMRKMSQIVESSIRRYVDTRSS